MQLKIDEHGYVTIYDLVSREYRKCWPVDAREQVDHGVASFVGPTLEVVKDGVGRKMVFDFELEEHEKQGFKLIDPSVSTPATAKPVVSTDKTDFTKFDIATLRKFGADAKVDESHKLTKHQLAEALDKIGYVPKQ